MDTNGTGELARAGEIARRLLELTVPPDPNTAPTDALAVAIGFFARCRRLLAGLIALADAGLGDTGEGLARSILEHTVTIGWLHEDQQERLEWLRRDALRNWAKTHREYEAVYGHPPPGQQLSEEALALARAPTELPSVKDRARQAGMAHWYVQFRLLSARSHSDLTVALEPGPIRLAVPLLAQGAMMVRQVARGISQALRLGWEPQLERIGEELHALAQADEGS